MVHHHLADEIQPQMSWNGGDVPQWQQSLRAKLRELLGLNNMPALKPDLNPHTLWQQQTDLGVIEKIAFTSEPGADVTAYLCTPNTPRREPVPVFICLQGHSTGMHVSIARQRDDETQQLQVEGDRDFALGCMRRGIAALCIEQRSFGQRREQVQEKISPQGCHDAAMHALALGRTLVGERVFDVDRGIDFLEQRGDFDMDKLGVMGNSGGGTVTTYSAAVLDRVKLAMPSCANSTFADSIMKIYHCADNYIPSILQYAEMGDILGLFAPRPLVVVAGKEDAIFPIAGVQKALTAAGSVYSAAEAKSNCQLVIGNGGHRFYAQPAWEQMLKHVD